MNKKLIVINDHCDDSYVPHKAHTHHSHSKTTENIIKSNSIYEYAMAMALIPIVPNEFNTFIVSISTVWLL